MDRSPPSYFLFQPLNLSPSPLTFLLSVVRLSMHTWGHECLLSVFDIKFPLGAGLKRPVCLARSPDASPTRRWTRPGCNTLLECLEFSTTRISSSLSVVSGWCVCHSSPHPHPRGGLEMNQLIDTHTHKSSTWRPEIPGQLHPLLGYIVLQNASYVTWLVFVFFSKTSESFVCVSVCLGGWWPFQPSPTSETREHRTFQNRRFQEQKYKHPLSVNMQIERPWPRLTNNVNNMLQKHAHYANCYTCYLPCWRNWVKALVGRHCHLVDNVI